MPRHSFFPVSYTQNPALTKASGRLKPALKQRLTAETTLSALTTELRTPTLEYQCGEPGAASKRLFAHAGAGFFLSRQEQIISARKMINLLDPYSHFMELL